MRRWKRRRLCLAPSYPTFFQTDKRRCDGFGRASPTSGDPAPSHNCLLLCDWSHWRNPSVNIHFSHPMLNIISTILVCVVNLQRIEGSSEEAKKMICWYAAGGRRLTTMAVGTLVSTLWRWCLMVWIGRIKCANFATWYRLTIYTMSTMSLATTTTLDVYLVSRWMLRPLILVILRNRPSSLFLFVYFYSLRHLGDYVSDIFSFVTILLAWLPVLLQRESVLWSYPWQRTTHSKKLI